MPQRSPSARSIPSSSMASGRFGVVANGGRLGPVFLAVAFVLLLFVALGGPSSADDAVPQLFSVSGERAFTTAPDDPAVVRRQFLDVGWGAFEGLENAPRVAVELFGGRRLVLLPDRVEPILESQSLTAEVEGIAGGSAVLVWGEGTVTGSVDLGVEGVFRIRPVGGEGPPGQPRRHVLEAVDRSAYPKVEDDGVEPPSSPDLHGAPMKGHHGADHGVDHGSIPLAPRDSGDQIDLMVVYTPAARVGAGGTGAIRQLISLGVVETNRAFANSAVSTRVRLVHVQEVAYAEDVSESDTLGRLAIRGDGHLDEVHLLRDIHGADLVKIVAEKVIDACGLGYQMRGLDPSFERWGFTYTARACISPNYTFAHELGHNMGCRHAPDDSFGGGGAFSYSAGFKDPTQLFRTVMAYDCEDGCRRRLYWSNPRISLFPGHPVGTPSQDNARSIQAARNITANFRPSGGTVPGRLELATTSLRVEEGDGRVEITVRRVAGRSGRVSVDWSVSPGSAQAGVDFGDVGGTLVWNAGDSGTRTLTVPLVDDTEAEDEESFSVRLTNPTGGAALGASVAQVTVEDDDVEPFECVSGPDTACLLGGRFEVRVDWRDFAGVQDTASSVPAPSDGSALFWFFDDDNWEMLVKVLDGCGVNDRFWVFLAATTNVEYTLTVTDSVAGQIREYTNALGTSAPASTDVDAFDTCPP
ncbi:MAG: Calx-beta domain-containing protein [Acidobacteriota bacterium]